MQTSTMSACRVSAAPPLAGSTVSVTPEPVASALVTLEPSLNVSPCLASERWKCLVISSSTPGVMRSRNSTTVTSDPSRRQTEPSSRPMMPAPTTTRCFGTSASSSAPVDDTIFFSSTVTPGSGVTSEPEAIRMFFAESVSFTAPSSPSTETAPALSMRPVPWNEAILFFLNRKATPLVVASTTSPLRFMQLAEVELGRAEHDAVDAKTVACLLEEMRGLQQRLGRDAADIEAGAAQGGALLDHRHLHAELGGADRRHVAAGPGADDDEIEGFVCHDATPPG